MKIHGKGGLLDFSKDKLTERNKENSFLDVDWIIEELINYGHEKMANSVPKSPNNTSLQSSAAIKSKFKKKVHKHFTLCSERSEPRIVILAGKSNGEYFWVKFDTLNIKSF